MKVLGWIIYVIGAVIIWAITDGFWLPLIGMMMIAIGVLLARGDRIRNMSDEELVKFLHEVDSCPWVGQSCRYLDNEDFSCKDCIAEWLREEVG